MGGVVNDGSASNASNGSAAISTGDASAIGNQSNTSISQAASSPGLLGGLVLINQGAGVLNGGVAIADTGQNTANGNDSSSSSGLLQTANVAAGLAANSGAATNASDGKATISTGNASAVGNKSDSSVVQSSTGSAGGALGGLVIIGQVEGVANLGAASATTGGNEAVGNDSGSRSGAIQRIADLNPVLTGVGSNSAEASNASDGSASITTGDATAVGNDSRTTLDQGTVDELGEDGGVALAIQANGVVNLGIATANTGDNGAVGNGSDNDVTLVQNIEGFDVAPYAAVGSNGGSAGNTSDGTASIRTGSAWAVGNTSTTAITQRSEANGGDLNLLPQVSGVANVGVAQADSGDNFAGGNGSENVIFATQDIVWSEETPIAAGVQSNSGDVSNSSDGSASIATGSASAKGNVSTTSLEQTLDPTGLVIPTQVAAVVNLGVGTASSGDNLAEGNVSDNASIVAQAVHIGENSGPPVTIVAGQLVGSNAAEVSNASDGSGAISTGSASATGNDSTTSLAQTSDGEIDGLGLVINTQAAAVANLGLGVADTGGNQATGNESQNDANLTQTADIGSDDSGDVTILGGIVAASNSGATGTTSDGDAAVATGAATATGNDSTTTISQVEGGDVSGVGAVINTQVAGVVNAGAGVASSGGNTALGNVSNNRTDGAQTALIGSDNLSGDVTVAAGSIVASNQGDVSTSSDGSASVVTGAATATGNASSTDLSQATDGSVSGAGLVLDTQVGVVVNAGLGVANSGANLAIGNASDNDQVFPGDLNLTQNALIGSGNVDDPVIDVTIAAPSVTASNSGEASTASDGSGSVRTGAATAAGNVSSTTLDQDPDSSVDGLGVVIGTQVGGVANVGVGVANSGANLAIGNASGQLDLIAAPVIAQSGAALFQNAEIGSNNNVDAGGGDVLVLAAGPVAATNSGSAANDSDGTAKVGTGNATATGNASSTDLVQQQSGNVEEMGLVIGTQVGGVANVGIAVANSGLNAAVGNASSNVAAHLQNALVASEQEPGDTIAPITALGPVVASNSGQASNASDGEACACTGDSTASGNVSQTTLGQDLDLATTTGTVILTEAGGVLNAGVGIANSGANLAVGNLSNSTAGLSQTSTINDALLGLPIVGPQVANNGGSAANTSDGTGKVGSGNATATGNLSTTDLAQAAAVDSELAVSALTGGTANAGLGVANAGLNLGIGNLSTNQSLLVQDADGGGIVSNSGEATNDSDGTATIGDPDCDEPIVEEPPGPPALPKTGSELEAEAAIALMLLLVGFGLRRKGQQRA